MDLPLPFEASFVAPASFDDLVERHHRMVYRTAWRLLGSAADAEDVSQDVFLKLHKRLGEFVAEENPQAWLYRVTVNLCFDQLRRRRPQLEVENLPLAAAGAGPDEVASARQQLDRLTLLLPKLAPGERAALVLREIEGLSTREAAQVLEVSEETVRTSIHRAKEKLRQWMS
jgi:RNA polymerase sigma-70 factor (ECF subfamily)